MQRRIEPRVGEVWDLNFDPRAGREQGGIRPALVISNDSFDRVLNGLHVVAPITGNDRGVRLDPRETPPDGGLSRPSVIMCDQARKQSELRFLRTRGNVPDHLLWQVQALVGECIDR